MVLAERRRDFFAFSVGGEVTREMEGQSIFPPPVAVQKRIFRPLAKKKRFCVGPAVEVGPRRKDREKNFPAPPMIRAGCQGFEPAYLVDFSRLPLHIRISPPRPSHKIFFFLSLPVRFSTYIFPPFLFFLHPSSSSLTSLVVQYLYASCRSI